VTDIDGLIAELNTAQRAFDAKPSQKRFLALERERRRLSEALVKAGVPEPPRHDPLVCGVYYAATCAACRELWHEGSKGNG
jgi:hypothetical protein